MRNAGLDEAQAEIKIAGRNINNLRYADDRSWQVDGETMETMRTFILGGSKITADCDCSHEIKRRLLLGRKAMTYQDSILKSRDITFSSKVHLI